MLRCCVKLNANSLSLPRLVLQPCPHLALYSNLIIMAMIEVVCNDRLGKKVRVKCNADDTIGDLKKMIAAQTGTRPEKIRIQKWYTIYKDHITLQDYEIHDGMNVELYYN